MVATTPTNKVPAGTVTAQAEQAVPGWLRVTAAWTWRLLILMLAGLAVLWLMARLLVVSLPLIIALLVATLCIPPAQWLKNRGMRPGLAASIVVIGGLVAIIGLIAVLTPSFISQLEELGPTVAAAWDDVLTWLEEGPLGYDRARIEELISSIGDMVSEAGSGLVVGVLSGAAVVAQGIAALVLFVVLLFFIVKDGDTIVAWGLARTSPRHRDTVVAVSTRAWNAMAGYVRGTALIALIDAVGIMIGLLIIGVPLVAPLTLLVFLGGFLPVIGAFLAGLIAVLVALASGGIVTAMLALAVIVGVQQLEGNLLQPTIMKRAVALHPLVILLALGAGTALAGIVGAFLSVPIAAVLAAIGNEIRLRAEAKVATGDDVLVVPTETGIT